MDDVICYQYNTMSYDVICTLLAIATGTKTNIVYLLITHCTQPFLAQLY